MYSNLEARVVAYVVKDPVFIAAVEAGNLHDVNAQSLFHVTPKHPLWKKARAAAKIFQFGRIKLLSSINSVNSGKAKGKDIFSMLILSQAREGSLEGATTRSGSPERTVKAHERRTLRRV